MENYEQQAQDFLTKTGATLKIEFKNHGKHFNDDKETRDIYKVTISRGSRRYSFDFGQSIHHSGLFKVRNYPRAGVFQTIEAARKQLPYSEWRNIIRNENYEKPSAYSILCCLTKYDPGTLEDFCSEFGYDTDSKSAEEAYNAVCDEYKNVAMLFSDKEIEALQEIQ